MDQTWPAGDGHRTQDSSMSQTQDFCWNYWERKFLFFPLSLRLGRMKVAALSSKGLREGQERQHQETKEDHVL